MTKSITLDQLEQRRNDINKQIKAAKEKKRKQARQMDEKRHAIIGKLLLKEADNQPDLKQTIDTLIQSKLTRKTDSALFDLPPLPGKPTLQNPISIREAVKQH